MSLGCIGLMVSSFSIFSGLNSVGFCCPATSAGIQELKLEITASSSLIFASSLAIFTSSGSFAPGLRTNFCGVSNSCGVTGIGMSRPVGGTTSPITGSADPIAAMRGEVLPVPVAIGSTGTLLLPSSESSCELDGQLILMSAVRELFCVAMLLKYLAPNIDIHRWLVLALNTPSRRDGWPVEAYQRS